MKRLILAITLLAAVCAAGNAQALTVNFSSITQGQNIVVPDSVYLDGITMSYDDYGTGTEFASVDSLGIFGSTGGAMILDFALPTTRLDLGFSLLEAVSSTPQMTDALIVFFYSAGEYLDAATAAADFFAYDPAIDPTIGNATGFFTYEGSPFDHAELYFSLSAPLFTVDTISYEPVPEPGTVLLLSAGVLAAGVWCTIRRRCFKCR